LEIRHSALGVRYWLLTVENRPKIIYFPEADFLRPEAVAVVFSACFADSCFDLGWDSVAAVLLPADFYFGPALDSLVVVPHPVDSGFGSVSGVAVVDLAADFFVVADHHPVDCVAPPKDSLDPAFCVCAFSSSYDPSCRCDPGQPHFQNRAGIQPPLLRECATLKAFHSFCSLQ
jgi:hypothetical protein